MCVKFPIIFNVIYMTIIFLNEDTLCSNGVRTSEVGAC